MADPGISPSEMEAVLRTEQAERELRAALAENADCKPRWPHKKAHYGHAPPS
jgi:hypothetical protein